MPVRVGFIGTGNQGQAHMKQFAKLDNCRIAAVYDFNQELAAQTAEQYGASVAGSSDELLNPSVIDAVVISSPQFTRTGLEETAARRGIHLLAEKPLGLELKSVQKNVEIIKQSGIINAAGYCLRYLDIAKKAKEYLESRSANLIQVVRTGTCLSWPSWMRQQHLSGGNLIAGVTHQVDLVRFLGGEFREVAAMQCDMDGPGKNPGDTILTSGVISFSMERGGIGTVSETVMSPYHSETTTNFIGHDFFVGIHNYTLTIIDQEQNITIESQVDMLHEQAKAFTDAIEQGNQDIVLSSYIDGFQTLAVTLAAEQSAQQRRNIVLEEFLQQ